MSQKYVVSFSIRLLKSTLKYMDTRLLDFLKTMRVFVITFSIRSRIVLFMLVVCQHRVIKRLKELRPLNPAAPELTSPERFR